MPGRKHLRGVSKKGRRQYGHIQQEAEASGQKGHRTGAGAVSGTPTIYCLTCQALRVIKNWHEQGEALMIELEPCGHVLRRCARLEWRVKTAAA